MEHAGRIKWISESAYFIAEARGFEPRKELDDWLKAKKKHAEMTVAYYFKVIEEDKAMITIANLHLLADALGIENAWHIQTEEELVLAIQKAGQRLTCFRSKKKDRCKKLDCRWRNECRKIIAVWMR